MILFIASLALIIIALFIASVIIANDVKTKASKTFFFMSVTASVWVFSNMLAVVATDPGFQEFGTRLITPSSLLVTYSLFLFLNEFPYRLKQTSKLLEVLLLCLVVLISLGAFTSLNVTADGVGPDGRVMYVFGELYYPYLAVLTALVVASTVTVRRKLARGKTNDNTHLRTVLYGLITSLIFAALTGAILPFLGVKNIWDYSPLFGGIGLGYAAYAIVRYELFDVRRRVFRVLLYIGTLLAIGLIYAAIVFVAPQRLFESNMSISPEVAYFLLALTLFATFPVIKRLFERLTVRLFYRDYYEPSESIKWLNSELVASIETSDIAQRSQGVLMSVLQPRYLQIFTVQPKTKKLEVYSAGDLQRKSGLAKSRARDLLKQSKPHHVITRLNARSSLFRILRSADAAITMRIDDSSGEQLGLLVLGARKNGSAYFSEDVQFLETATQSLSLALGNARKFAEVSAFNETLQEKVDTATEDLRTANKELTQLSVTKDDFIAMTSHQLKPQIMATDGFLELVDREGSKLTTDQSSLVGLAREGTKRMAAIVKDMMDLTRLESGTFKLHKVRAEPNSLAREVVKQQSVRAKQADVALEFTSALKTETAHIDRVMIAECMTNLVANAIEYSAAKDAKVTVTLKPFGKNGFEFSVQDNGIGVPTKDREQIFNKFQRANNAVRHRPAGTGTGLYLVKNMIELHSGEVFYRPVESGGSVFGFKI